MNEYSDKEIISALKSKDNKILKQVFYEYKEEFAVWVKQKYNLKNIDDLYQEMFAALLVNADKGNLDRLKASVKTYFFTIGKYKVYNSFDEEKASNIDENEELNLKVDSNPKEFEALFRLNDEQWKLKQILETSLNETRCQELLQRIYYMEEKADEIIQAMNFKNSNVLKSMKYRCLKKLRILFSQSKMEEDESRRNS